MKKALFLLISIATLLGACSKSFEETYGGVWTVTFQGSYDGVGTINVANDGTYSDDVVFDGGFWVGNITNHVQGSVDDNGKITGDIYMSGDKIGTISGNLRDDKTGTGTYQTDIPTSGTWVAVK